MVSAALPTPPEGSSEPSSVLIPECDKSLGDEAVDLAGAAGIHLDPWEEFVLRHSLGLRGGKWAAPEVGLVVPRQNGKGEVLLARQLVGVFLVGEMLITHSAHQFDTSQEHFRRVRERLEASPDLDRRVQRITRSHGEEGIEFKNGARIRFRTRTKGGGRGFSGDLLVLDEAMILPESALAALLPTLSARANPQVWFAGSAVDQDIHEHGKVLARVRESGHKGEVSDLAYFEWAAEGDLDDPAVADNRKEWARANPGMGIRISEEHIARERRQMAARTFCVERLGIGDWPSLEENDEDGISAEAWEAALDGTSSPNDPIVIAFDVRPNRSAGAIGMAGLRSDGKYHIEVIEHRKGTGWMPDLLAKLDERHRPSSIICDLRSPAASLLAACDDLGLNIETVGVTEHAQGCGMIFDAVDNDLLRHLDQKELAAAVRGAIRRPLGDAWAWSRKSSAVDISPLVACTLALYGIASLGESVYEQRGILTVGS